MSSATIKNIILWGALLLVVVVLVVGTHNALTVRVPGMNDFIIRYEGARSFWLEGVSPYSEQATLNIQMAMYGKPYPPPHEFVAPLVPVPKSSPPHAPIIMNRLFRQEPRSLRPFISAPPSNVPLLQTVPILHENGS